MDETRDRELKTATEVLAPAEAVELTTQQPNVVINALFIVWMVDSSNRLA